MAGITNTVLDPVVANRVASDHRSTADDVDRQKATFNDAVDLMDGACEGAMIRAVLSARETWVKEVDAIVADLREMAGNVDGTVQDFDAQDHANASQVGAVGLDILRDI
ncbi:excreted virulence factor EspC (type VII ESX diderm) [Micromonospora sp. Llam0]|uniref:type VII secretion target n=1 Tax=Micromonospora sp. Llam0 TaxID=2485143 RepID=UPI000F9E25F9|nr:type VII secretion target [Micromonospora sp. Llam0]ROO63203.1 excreted virulence factor EspC (type VII ESX diderm) [Micromonospora sp. Llam0]